MGRAVFHFGQHLRWDVEQLQHARVPFTRADIVKQRARGIGGICRVNFAAGEPPNEEAVDGAEAQFALFSAGAGTFHIVQEPFDLGAGEIGIEPQSRAAIDLGFIALGAQICAKRLGAAVLPDDGAVDGLAGFAIPDHGGFALVGDANADNRFRLDAGLFDGGLGGGEDGFPDVFRVMLDMTGGGEVLLEFLLGGCLHLQLFIENDGA